MALFVYSGAVACGCSLLRGLVDFVVAWWFDELIRCLLFDCGLLGIWLLVLTCLCAVVLVCLLFVALVYAFLLWTVSGGFVNSVVMITICLYGDAHGYCSLFPNCFVSVVSFVVDWFMMLCGGLVVISCCWLRCVWLCWLCFGMLVWILFATCLPWGCGCLVLLVCVYFLLDLCGVRGLMLFEFVVALLVICFVVICFIVLVV